MVWPAPHMESSGDILVGETAEDDGGPWAREPAELASVPGRAV